LEFGGLLTLNIAAAVPGSLGELYSVSETELQKLTANTSVHREAGT
jgi:hypothetical protein